MKQEACLINTLLCSFYVTVHLHTGDIMFMCSSNMLACLISNIHVSPWSKQMQKWELLNCAFRHMKKHLTHRYDDKKKKKRGFSSWGALFWLLCTLLMLSKGNMKEELRPFSYCLAVAHHSLIHLVIWVWTAFNHSCLSRWQAGLPVRREMKREKDWCVEMSE